MGYGMLRDGKHFSWDLCLVLEIAVLVDYPTLYGVNVHGRLSISVLGHQLSKEVLLQSKNVKLSDGAPCSSSKSFDFYNIAREASWRRRRF